MSLIRFVYVSRDCILTVKKAVRAYSEKRANWKHLRNGVNNMVRSISEQQYERMTDIIIDAQLDGEISVEDMLCLHIMLQSPING